MVDHATSAPAAGAWSLSAGACALIAAAAFSAGFLLARAPRYDLILAAPGVVQAHLYAAVAALGVGGALLLWRKGRTFHRFVGWIWVIAVGVAIVTAAFIMDEESGRWSWIHAATAWTALALPIGVLAAKRHDVKLHRRMMTALYIAGLIGALALAFIPDRLMWRVFFG
ncbi:MAG: hypothetical protein GC206_12105 [Alphaproteobacteria bacterium]|nr:hypothetical protein [Alphaproteobacteria bacterium]